MILGGGGEVGVAWEIGVLAALESEAGFEAGTSEVIAGTSAGAIVGAYAAQGRAMPELAELERRGQGVPVGAGFGADPAVGGGDDQANKTAIPEEIIGALMSTEGTLEERGARLGTLALQAPVSLDEAVFVDGFRTMQGRRRSKPSRATASTSRPSSRRCGRFAAPVALPPGWAPTRCRRSSTALTSTSISR